MRLSPTERQQYETSAAAAEECVEAAAFVAAFGFPVSAPLALYAAVQVGAILRRLADEQPRADYASRTTVGIGRMSHLELGDDVIGPAPDLSQASKVELRATNSAAALRKVGRTTFFSAVAADEAVDWLTAALRAQARAEAVPKTATSHARSARRTEAYHYFLGASNWLDVYDLGPLEYWVRNSTDRLGREVARVQAGKARDTSLRVVIEANLQSRNITSPRPADVARVFPDKPAAAVAKAFNPASAAEVIVRADQGLSTAGGVLLRQSGVAGLQVLSAPA